MKEVLKARSPRQNLPLFRSLVAVAVVSKRRPYLLSGVFSTNGVSFLTFKERIGIPFKIDHSPSGVFRLYQGCAIKLFRGAPPASTIPICSVTIVKAEYLLKKDRIGN